MPQIQRTKATTLKPAPAEIEGEGQSLQPQPLTIVQRVSRWLTHLFRPNNSQEKAS